MLSLCLCRWTSNSGQTKVNVNRASERRRAPSGHRLPRPPTPARHTSTAAHGKLHSAFSRRRCSRQGHRANTRRAQLSMVKVCRAPGSRDARHTDKRAALRERLPGGLGWAYGKDTRWARSIAADMAYTVSVLTDSVRVFKTGENPKVKPGRWSRSAGPPGAFAPEHKSLPGSHRVRIPASTA